MKTQVEIAAMILALTVLPSLLLLLSWLQWRRNLDSNTVVLLANLLLSAVLTAWLVTAFEGEWGRYEMARVAAWMWVPLFGGLLSLISFVACWFSKRSVKLPAFYASLLFLITNLLAFYSNGV